ncbi:PilZ domain-containing protein [Sphingomonas sp. SAFR-052]|uniref:PilZ domain-containing protein n=1 Tax=Sphingomonas sp. SAFR-052 TaxID=3436867 RepID=UPI003F80FCB9
MSEVATDQPAERSRRDSVILNARIETPDGMVECRVRNLSQTGACIDNVGNLRAGDRVLVTMGMVHHVEASVRWANGGRAGLHFEGVEIDIAAARRPRGTVSAAPRNVAGWLDNMYSPYRRGGD